MRVITRFLKTIALVAVAIIGSYALPNDQHEHLAIGPYMEPHGVAMELAVGPYMEPHGKTLAIA